jgi:hypothetical protein
MSISEIFARPNYRRSHIEQPTELPTRPEGPGWNDVPPGYAGRATMPTRGVDMAKLAAALPAGPSPSTIAADVRTMTYGQLIEMGAGLHKTKPASLDTPEAIAAWLHKWAANPAESAAEQVAA